MLRYRCCSWLSFGVLGGVASLGFVWARMVLLLLLQQEERRSQCRSPLQLTTRQKSVKEQRRRFLFEGGRGKKRCRSVSSGALFFSISPVACTGGGIRVEQAQFKDGHGFNSHRFEPESLGGFGDIISDAANRRALSYADDLWTCGKAVSCFFFSFFAFPVHPVGISRS